MTGKRSYDDPCGVARALNTVGERWALLVVRELLLGPKRFRELARGLPGLSDNVLSARLRELEGNGVVAHYTLGPPASTPVYGLTDRGLALQPVLLALAGWGSRVPTDSAGDLSPDALMLALRSTFAPDRAADLSACIELRVDRDTFTVEVGGGGLRIGRGNAAAPDATLSADPTTLRALVFAGRPLDRVLADGAATLAGDHNTAARILRCFPPPNRQQPCEPGELAPRPADRTRP